MFNALRVRFSVVLLTTLLATAASHTDSYAADRQGDRFGIRLGAWPQSDVAGTLAPFIQFTNDPDTIYRATIEEDGQIAPFLELFGLFNLSGMWWVEISAGFSQRTNVQVDGIRVEPPVQPNAPKGDSTASKILLAEGRVDFIPLFLGARAVKDLGKSDHPHNIYGRGGVSMLIAAEQPNAIHPTLDRTIYSEGTKAAFGFLIGGGAEYYLSNKVGLTADVAYRMSDLGYTDDGNFDLSGLWASAGITIRVR